jgi:hypothetical protein
LTTSEFGYVLRLFFLSLSISLYKKNLRTYPNSAVVNFTKNVIQWYAKTEEENLRTYPNSAVVNFTKRCYTMIC